MKEPNPNPFIILEGASHKTVVVFKHEPYQAAQLALLRWLRETAEQTRRAAR